MKYIYQAFKGKSDLWRWLLMLIVFFTLSLNKKISGYLIKPLFKLVGNNANFQLSVLLFKSVLLLLVFYVFFKILHKRKFVTLITGRNKVNWFRYFFAFSMWAMLMIISFTISVVQNPDDYTLNFTYAKFLELLTLLAILVPLQVLFNEVLLHGYVYQFFAKIFKKKRVFLIVLIVLLSFYDLTRNNFILKEIGWQILILNVAMNLVMTLSTYIDDGIETILGMKTANNFVGLLYVVSSASPIKHSALFVNSSGTNIFMLVYFTAFVVCPVYLFILSKTYRWDWSKLVSKKEEKEA